MKRWKKTLFVILGMIIIPRFKIEVQHLLY